MKYKGIIACAAAIVALWLLRSSLSGSLQFYGFITANIFLATIPLLTEFLFKATRKYLKGIVAKCANLITAIVWLLFIPNAFYILTDFMHLNPDVLVNVRDDNYNHATYYIRGDPLYIFDSLLVFAATAYGAYVGGLALVEAYVFFKRRMSSLIALSAIGLIMVLSAIGVYIGRFGRWNSWEGLSRPWDIIIDLLSSLSHQAIRERFILVIITIFIFQCLSFWYIHENYKKT